MTKPVLLNEVFAHASNKLMFRILRKQIRNKQIVILWCEKVVSL